MKELLKIWETDTGFLAAAFTEKHFGKDAEVWWVADEIGGVLHVNDHFFNIGDIVDFVRYRYSTEKMFDYYQYALDCHEKGKTPINIKSFKYLKNGK